MSQNCEGGDILSFLWNILEYFRYSCFETHIMCVTQFLWPNSTIYDHNQWAFHFDTIHVLDQFHMICLLSNYIIKCYLIIFSGINKCILFKALWPFITVMIISFLVKLNIIDISRKSFYSLALYHQLTVNAYCPYLISVSGARWLAGGSTHLLGNNNFLSLLLHSLFKGLACFIL